MLVYKDSLILSVRNFGAKLSDRRTGRYCVTMPLMAVLSACLLLILSAPVYIYIPATHSRALIIRTTPSWTGRTHSRWKITSTVKQVLGNCKRMVLANFVGNRLSTFILWIWLSTFTLYVVLVHLCTVHAKSLMNHACVMFCPCPTPIFKIYISEILYETELKRAKVS